MSKRYKIRIARPMSARLGAVLCVALIGATPLHASSVQYGDAPSIPGSVPPRPIGDHACHYKRQPAEDIILELTITAEGTTRDLTLKKSSSVPELDALALQCVSAFKYQPATLNGQAIDYPWTLRVDWVIGMPASPDAWLGMKETQKQLKDELHDDPNLIPKSDGN